MIPLVNCRAVVVKRVCVQVALDFGQIMAVRAPPEPQNQYTSLLKHPY